ncbi:3-hydroxyacyl-CoA dehydrogenase family protein [Lentimicrobium sp.]|jgi:3-hydroxybutyryl-CoA dehydrogenase|uniref:3-hydroxyacyl-CoA dehydrogenase family protein n=1 Tax=Lentimicrobium sp. TaxID=2034841 RepID=UPI0025F4628F|nr:3-hydroxyacyl-CoA dehydrogenase family protein [Lentimicrobium sp.]MCO5256934.1 3-hydroxyacyl-CoA dehydrogenase family protein [Lentimicrobium sp.]HOP12654.1 3-hydroxyacyl-CoA dehydrogenase family protein [Lentimicrobium sp.]HPF64274.1 3-hydroxyacyl-CoA dehydrogenase family protein [Lentimicrobium sp.]HPJ61927.1 3-hydroxyacyl-CoA dehydrogenase family protein [Lentimicrobium sp.]HPR25695.1 3-hydroxyacyl-CoA dehydrogenase family protein [Lentimicrobium sp.]
MSERLEDFSLGKSMQPKGSIQKVGVVGCGTMGQEISVLISQSGIEVAFIDISDERIAEVFRRIEQQLDDRISKWGLTGSEKKLILSRIKGSTDYSTLADCDIVFETVNSKKKGTSLDLRQDIFRKIEAVVSPDAVIASNTATLMISEISSVLKNRGRAMGLHFFSPVGKIKVIEAVRSVYTTDETYAVVSKLALLIGKRLINVNESAGNISTRMLVPLINEACEILMEGVATVSDIDETMKETSGLQLGPFEMADKIGLDKVLKWMENLYAEFGEHKYKPSPVLKRLVRANLVGRRTGEGFYLYQDNKRLSKKGSITNLGRG